MVIIMALTSDQLKKLARIKDLQALATKVKELLTNSTGVTSVTLAKDETAETGYAASYTLSVNGTALGTKINIPKDFLVKSATLQTVSTDDTPYTGAEVGDKYIDFVINAKDASATAEHIYLPVNDLVDAYTAGNGLTLSGNTFSVNVDSSNANGLSVTASGLAMATVTASTSGVGGSNGAMLATDKEKLNGISSEANKVTVTTEGAGTLEIDGTSKTIVNIASDSDITAMIADVFDSGSSSGEE
jgi:hypothetical protein